MKNTILLTIIALLFGACSYKNEAIRLQPYETNYKAPLSKEKKTIFLNAVNDQREQKQNIGYALENGEKKVTFFSNEDFTKKYKDALLYALNVSEFNTNVSQDDASATITLFIKDIELVQTDKSFDENLKGKISIELVVKEGKAVTKHNFTIKAGKWIAPSHSSRDLEPFLSTLFSDSIDKVVSKLAE